eukprot:2724590-Rhodomonas_salina.1
MEAWGELMLSASYQCASEQEKAETLALVAADGFIFFQGCPGGNSDEKATARHARVGLLVTAQGGFK